MSEPDQNKIIGSITKKILWAIVPMLVVFMSIQFIADARANKKKADESYVDSHYRELYRLTAELSTTLSMYMQANEKDKEQLRKRMDYLIERMDKFSDKDVKRGTTKLESNTGRKYGLEFTSLI